MASFSWPSGAVLTGFHCKNKSLAIIIVDSYYAVNFLCASKKHKEWS